MKTNGLLILLLYTTLQAQEQIISGEVFSSETNEPVIGATVFYDGSSLGTITDSEGRFLLRSRNTINGVLIIRSLGLETVSLPKLETQFVRVFLNPAPIELEEVEVRPDSWSREKKMGIFLREFLGSSCAGCEISNPQDIRLYYNKNKNVLKAFSKRPLQINNPCLGFKLLYEIKDFEINLSHESDEGDAVASIYFAGNTLFLDEEVDRSKYFAGREAVYFGSKLHFFRSLYSNRLEEEGFELYKNGTAVTITSLFDLQTIEALLYVAPKLENDEIGILFKGKEQSILRVLADEFVIDPFGNHSPASGVLFGGEMGQSRVCKMLPIDYEVED